MTLVSGLARLIAQVADYHSRQEAWRTAREASLLEADGWLTMSALHFLRDGHNSFGTSPVNDLVLTEGPENGGCFELRNGGVSVTATAGHTVTINGTDATRAVLYPHEDDRMTLRVGQLSLWVHTSGERLAIRVSDPNSAIRKIFSGLKWFSDR